MKKKLILLLGFSLLSFNLSAQSTIFDQMRKIPLASPEVASLAKAVEFPVSYFNGKPDISIPLYTIQSGDIQLPISLSYNAGGIRVSEEASWVGLGWNLNAGGVIIHDIKGSDDDYNYTNLSFTSIFPNGSGIQYDVSAQPLSVRASQNGLYNSTGGIYTNEQVNTLLSGAIDGEPDLYIYNFGKFSGKFAWLSSTEVVDISNNNIKFEKSGNMIIATTPDGFKYEFGAIEWAISPNGPTKTAYYLTKITSSTNRSLTFSYKTFKDYVYPSSGYGHSNDYVDIGNAFNSTDYVRQIPTLSEEYIMYQLMEYVWYIDGPNEQPNPSVIPTNTQLNRNFTTSEIRSIYLDKISFDNGYVQFAHGSRNDLYGIKLDAFGIYNNEGGLIKDITFSYDYFTGRSGFESYTTLGNGYKPTYKESYRKQRLKLSRITIGAEDYKFQYYEGSDGFTLPFKSSFAQDYWGYYNGMYGNTTLVPDFTRYNFLSTVPSILSQWVGANRDANFDKAIEGTLKKIEYPTQGYTEFEFEMNEYGNGPTQQGITYNIVGALNTGPGVTETYVDITTDTYVDISVSLFCNSAADATPSGTGWDCGCVFPPCSPNNIQNSMYAMIQQVNPQTNQVISSPSEWQYDFGKDIVRNHQGIVYLHNVLLHTGKYKLTANYPDNKVGEAGSRMAYIYLNIPHTTNSGGYGKGGGLRISSIRNYDPLSKKSVKKYYKYEQAIMMKFPKYYNRIERIVGDDRNFTAYSTHTLFSSTVVPYSFSANGSLVGYGKVTESYTGDVLGKTEYQYMLNQDKYRIIDPQSSELDFLPGTPSTPFLNNGFLSLVTIYNKDNQIVKKVYNSPKIELTKTYWAFAQRKILEGFFVTHPYSDFIQMSFYPIQVGKLLTGSTREEIYDNNNAFTTFKEFDYSDKGYIKTEKQTISNGSILTKHYRYPTDFDSFSSWLADLKSKNIINNPLEVVTKKDDKLIDGSFTIYKSHDNIITPNEIYLAETANPSNTPFIAPSGTIPAEYKQKGILEYDATGNMSFSKGTNNISIGYKWGYNQQYTIAECKNATNIEFMFEDFEGNGSIVSNSTTAHTGKGGYNGTVYLQNYFNPTLNGRTYRLSYFKIDGNGKWVNVEENYTGQSITGMLDDIRIFPTDGEIKTYTYEPLVGITSSIDPSGKTTYYNYDNFKRLLNIKDLNGNILKSYNYNYSTVLGLDNNTIFYNVAITQSFTKQCSLGTGSNVPYSVTAGKYSASTQDDANAKAQAEIALYGQSNADQLGTCSTNNGPPILISVLNGSGADIIVNYSGPSGANFLYLFILDVASGTFVNNLPFTLSLSQTSFTTPITKGKTYNIWLLAGGQNYPTSLSSQTISINYP